MLRSITHDPNDDERRGAASEWDNDNSSPLDHEDSNDQRKRENGCFCAPQLFGGGIYLPDPSTYDPIEILLNTHDKRSREELTRKWRDNKLSELNFVGVVVRTVDSIINRRIRASTWADNLSPLVGTTRRRLDINGQLAYYSS
jgi:hypothetical protein